ncbi:hypothetical protein [Cryobacterium sp. MLB-32]|uniref:hypothetical protein n=1 Tax=Cryobacterium sp. MLB-32 TaxID=1529318 RepID=UPI000A5C441D|nr:hypothetical protein [Cryobacterium sp. MLB-32]
MNVVAFIIAFAIFVLGIWLFGFAFTAPALQGAIFISGILAISVSLAIPFHILRN